MQFLRAHSTPPDRINSTFKSVKRRPVSPHYTQFRDGALLLPIKPRWGRAKAHHRRGSNPPIPNELYSVLPSQPRLFAVRSHRHGDRRLSSEKFRFTLTARVRRKASCPDISRFIVRYDAPFPSSEVKLAARSNRGFSPIDGSGSLGTWANNEFDIECCNVPCSFAGKSETTRYRSQRSRGDPPCPA